MPLTSLRTLVAGRVPAMWRLSLSRMRHGEVGPANWRRDRARQRRAAAIAADPSLATVDGAAVARDASQVWSSEEVLNVVAAALAAGRVEHAVLAAGPSRPTIAIAAEHRERLGAALERLPHQDVWRLNVETAYRNSWKPLRKAARAIGPKTVRLIVQRRFVAPNGREVDVAGRGDVAVELWDRLRGGERRADGGKHLAGTRVARAESLAVPYLSEEHWVALTQSEKPGLAFALPHLMEVQEPIDVVYTWVDGEDSEWLERKAQALSELPGQVNVTADTPSRFVSRDELRYSLRSLELYAPWVRHIYVVADRQRPEWLVDEHPRLTVVDHTEIFADASVLPVFNSHAIESQLHHIDGLSDRYLYLNDDVFFGRTVSKELFFEANGISKFFLSRATLDVGPASSRDLPVLTGAKHNAALLAKTWNRSVTNKFKHTPHTQNRAVLYELERRFPDIFGQVARSRIRHPDDYSIASALQHYYAYALGKAVPGAIRYTYVDITARDAELPLTRLLRARDMDVFCLNDTFADEAGHDRAARLGSSFLDAYFPVPSTFERK